MGIQPRIKMYIIDTLRERGGRKVLRDFHRSARIDAVLSSAGANRNLFLEMDGRRRKSFLFFGGDVDDDAGDDVDGINGINLHTHTYIYIEEDLYITEDHIPLFLKGVSPRN